MTQAEKDTVDAQLLADRIAALRAEADAALDKNEDKTLFAYRVLVRLVVDELNLLRRQLGLADRTYAQMQSVLKSRLAAGDGDA